MPTLPAGRRMRGAGGPGRGPCSCWRRSPAWRWRRRRGCTPRTPRSAAKAEPAADGRGRGRHGRRGRRRDGRGGPAAGRRRCSAGRSRRPGRSASSCSSSRSTSPLVIRLFMEMRVSEAVPAAAGREARDGDQGAEVPGGVRRLPRQRVVPRPAGPHRDRQPPQRPARGQGGDERRRPRRSSPAWSSGSATWRSSASSAR